MLPYRREILEDLEAGYDTLEDKCRRAGASWTVMTFAAHRTNFFPGYKSLALSRTEDDAFDLIDKVEFVLDHMAPTSFR